MAKTKEVTSTWTPRSPIIPNKIKKSHMLPFLVFLVNFLYFFYQMREEFEFEICTIHFVAEKMHVNSNSLWLSRLNLGSIS